MRIHELAKELGVASKDILGSLQEMGYEGRTASSTVPEEAVPRLRAAGGKVKPGSKPKVTSEKPAKAAPRKKSTAPPKEAEGNGQVAPDVAAQVVEPATVPEPVVQIP